MTPQEFMDNFGALADAPGGVNKLRTLVLDLSIRGRLTDEGHPDRIGERSTANGVPFDLPPSWEWRRVDDVGELKLGRQRSPKNHTGPHMRPYLRVANVFEARIDTSDILKMNFDPEEAKRFALAPNDVLLNEGQSTELVGRPAIYRGEVPGACFQNTLIRFRPHDYLTSEYALVVFRAYMRIGRFVSEAQQTTNMAHLSLGRLAAIEFPLPPLAEQKRIVAKVDQLMALLDDLDAKQGKRQHTVVRATTACLDALTTADGPDAVADAWKRVAGNWQVLFDRPEAVGELRGAILDLAIRGKTVEQDTCDQPARSVLERMRVERARSSKQSRGDRTPIECADGPFILPPTWVWSKLAHVWRVITDGDHQPPPKVESGVAFLTIGNVSGGALDFKATRFVGKDYFTGLDPNRVPVVGDLLYTVVGSFGKPVLVDSPRPFCVQRHIAILKPLKDTYVRFWWYALKSRFVFSQASAAATGIAQPTVGLGSLRDFDIPVPPLAEQKRIVAKVDQLMAFCDDLEAKLRRRDERAGKLVTAVVGEIVGVDREGELVPPEAELALAEGRTSETAEEMLARVKAGTGTQGAKTAKKAGGRPARGGTVLA